MTTTYHTPLPFGGPLTAAAMEAPLGQLDAQLVAQAAAMGSSALPLTTTDAVAAAGQPVVPVTATTNFIVGQPVWIGDVGGTYEVKFILSIQAAVSLTMTANLTNTYASGKIVSGSPSELIDARGGYTTLNLRLAAVAGVGAAFPGSPAANDLFRRTDRGNALYAYTGAAWVQVAIPAVTAFWGTPSTNDRCWRTDRGIEYSYDGTRWLSPIMVGYCPIQKALSPHTPPLAGVAVANGPSFNTLYSEWIVELFVSSFVSVANSGTNYWTVALVTPAATLVSLNTQTAINPSIWFQHRATAGVLAAAHNAKSIVLTTTGAPGTLDWSAMYTYRLVG